MSPTDLTMAAEEGSRESLESGTDQARDSLSRISTMQPSLTGPVSLTLAPKGDSPNHGKTPPPLAGTFRTGDHRNAAREEQEAIADFLSSMPMINDEFDIRYKIGEGTFSSVYLAALKGVPEEKVAIKHLVPTSSPSRIENEIYCLQLMGGRDHIMSLLACVRHRDHIALIMPYFKHDRFTDYLHVLSVAEVKEYMRALLFALSAVHSHQIIHRDVKPSNFLYNRVSRQFQLVDFGLAHAVQTKEELSIKPSSRHSRGRTAMRGESSSTTTAVSKVSGIAPPSTFSRQLHLRTSVRGQRATTSKGKVATSKGKSKQTESGQVKLCPIKHKLSEICDVCMARSHQAAPRAGTPGFRAPEVLLKSPTQTTAVDIWSAGVIFLCVLSGRYPFFRAHNDLSALTQIISLLGSERCSKAANEYGKDLVCVPEVEATNLRSLCNSLRTSISKSHDHTGAIDQSASPTKRSRLCKNSGREDLPKSRKNSKESKHNGMTNSLTISPTDTSWNCIPEDAFDLLYKLLDFNPVSRIPATQALEHSFLAKTQHHL